jgi:uncharacterized membrane protein YdbT with pleckstrin-like domain
MPVVFKAKSKPTRAKPELPVVSSSNGPEHHLFHSFCLRPSVRFETQGDDEAAILVLRAHPITQVPWVFTALIILILPFFFNVFLTNYLSTPQTMFLNFFWYGFLFSFIFVNILNYIFNVGIITNFRVIDVDFTNILYKEVTDTVLDKIQDVTVKTAGFVASLFNYGNLFIQTAGTEANIEFINIPNPTEAATAINNLMEINRGH